MDLVGILVSLTTTTEERWRHRDHLVSVLEALVALNTKPQLPII